MGNMTGEDYVHLTNKKILGLDDFGVDFLGYLRDRDEALATNVFQEDGTFGATKVGLAADGADKIQVTDIAEQTDGAGNLVQLPAGAGISTGLQFENTVAIPYYVALHHAERPRGVRINPRLGQPEFERYEEAIGERAEPDAVTVGGSTLTFEIDSVVEAGVSNAGRKCLVWKKTPGEYATLESQAVEETIVFYSGGKNQITTTTLLGQAIGVGVTADYYVLLLGPSVRRNTDLQAASGYAFIGTVTGAGAGNPPTVFDISGQWLIPYFSGFGDIVRTHTNGHLKIQVKSYAGESDVAQVEVLAPGGSTVFRVNEVGDVEIVGDLDVQGTTTIHDEVTVESSATITDNLTAGDDDATDSHLIKGGWRHTNNAETANYFVVDGPSGRVGFGQAPHGTDPFAVTGHSRFTGNVIPGADNAYDLGSMTNRWANLYAANIIFSGDFLPLVDNAQDIGSLSKRWDELWGMTHYVGDANFNFTIAGLDPTIQLDASDQIGFTRATNTLTFTIAGVPIFGMDGIGVSSGPLSVSNTTSDYTPITDNSFDLGSLTNRWAETWSVINYIQDANYNFSISGNVATIQFDVSDGIYYDRSANSFDFRSSGASRFSYASGTFTTSSNLDVGGSLDVTSNFTITGSVFSDFIPSPTETRDLGSATYRWEYLYAKEADLKFLRLSTSAGEGVVNTLVPTSAAGASLGSASHYWYRFYLGTAAGQGCGSNFVPIADSSLDLGSTTYRWANVYALAIGVGSVATGSIYGTFHNAGSYTLLGGRSPETAKKLFYIENLYATGGTPSGEAAIVFRTGTTVAPTQRLQINEDGRIQTGSSNLAVDCAIGGGLTIFPNGSGYAQTYKYSGVNTGQNSPHTDTYGAIGYNHATYGGIHVVGYGSASTAIGVMLNSITLAYNVTTSVTAVGTVTVETSSTSMPPTGNVFVVRNTQQGGAALIVKADGDLFVNSASNITGGAGYVNAVNNAVRYYDDEQDAVACQDLAYAMAGAWDKVLEYQKPELERLGVMKNGFISYRNATALTLGAIGELRLVVDHICKKFGLDYEDLRKELRDPKAIEA